MSEASVRQFSLLLTSAFAEVLPLHEAGLDQIAKQALRRFGGYGLRPLEVFQREGDKMFDYELSFSLFNRNGNFRVTAENVVITFNNARNEQDTGIISDCVSGILECMAGRRIGSHTLEAYVHAELKSDGDRNTFLEELCANQKGLPVKGAILYFPGQDGKPNSRLLVDRSLLFAEAVFLNWTVQYSTAEELLATAVAGFKEMSESIGLEYPKNESE